LIAAKRVHFCVHSVVAFEDSKHALRIVQIVRLGHSVRRGRVATMKMLYFTVSLMLPLPQFKYLDRSALLAPTSAIPLSRLSGRMIKNATPSSAGTLIG
jgi:hypothetical protein